MYREAIGIEDEETLSFGDPASNAESMALRRAAAKFDLELYLYDKGNGAGESYAGETNLKPKTLGDIVTPKRLWMIRNMGREMGCDVEQECQNLMKCNVARQTCCASWRRCVRPWQNSKTRIDLARGPRPQSARTVPGLLPEEPIMEKKKRERRDGVWKDQDSGIWRYRFMHKGRRYFGTVPERKNKTEAKAARDRRRIAVREGREDKAEADTNFRSFVKETFLPLVEMNKSPATFRSYRSRCEYLIKAFGDLELSQVSSFGIEKFKKERLRRVTKRKRAQTPASVNRSLLTLGSIWRRIWKQGGHKCSSSDNKQED